LALIKRAVKHHTPPKHPGSSARSVQAFWNLLEKGEYEKCWFVSAPTFKETQQQERWIQKLETERKPFGKAISRKTLSLEFIEPNVRFEQRILTEFENGKSAHESIICSRQPDGEWRIEDYQFQTPPQPESDPTNNTTTPDKGSTWFVSPLSSPKVREIVSHMTRKERAELNFMGALTGVWISVLSFGSFLIVRQTPDQWDALVFITAILLFFATLPLIWTMQRRLLCTTQWARQEGIDAQMIGKDTLKLFSLKHTKPVALITTLVVLGILIVWPQSVLWKIIRDVRSTVPAHTPRVLPEPNAPGIAFKFIKIHRAENKHWLAVYFERDKHPGYGIELTQALVPGPNDEAPNAFWRQNGLRKQWVGVKDQNILTWILPKELNEEEIQAGLRDLEQNAKRWSFLPEGAAPEFAHFRHRDGWEYVLWAHIKKEPKQGAPKLVPEPPTRTFTQEELDLPPVLEFLAWQDEWKEIQSDSVWHLDGSRIGDDQAKLNWLSAVPPAGMEVNAQNLDPEPRFLYMWFSHPAFDRASDSQVRLLNLEGNHIVSSDMNIAHGSSNANAKNGMQGWKYWTLSPGSFNQIPDHIDIELRYTVGPMEESQQLNPPFSGSISLAHGSMLGSVGQNYGEEAFISISVHQEGMRSKAFDIKAVTKNGAMRNRTGKSTSGFQGAETRMETHHFDVPLSEIETFIIGTRPYRTNIWRNVPLPKSIRQIKQSSVNMNPTNQ